MLAASLIRPEVLVAVMSPVCAVISYSRASVLKLVSVTSFLAFMV